MATRSSTSRRVAAGHAADHRLPGHRTGSTPTERGAQPAHVVRPAHSGPPPCSIEGRKIYPLRLPEEVVIYVMVHGSTTTGNDRLKTTKQGISFPRDMRGTASLITRQVSA